ncbi:MAG: DUF2065 domain-containing protein [Desulfovibrio sp.]|nr:DUF2065 domain-containing protein [Desulfovibrio sp.]
MNFDTELFLRALGLAIVLEGLCWTVSPKGMRHMLEQLLPLPEHQLRAIGLAALFLGLAVIHLAAKLAM